PVLAVLAAGLHAHVRRCGAGAAEARRPVDARGRAGVAATDVGRAIHRRLRGAAALAVAGLAGIEHVRRARADARGRRAAWRARREGAEAGGATLGPAAGIAGRPAQAARIGVLGRLRALADRAGEVAGIAGVGTARVAAHAVGAEAGVAIGVGDAGLAVGQLGGAAVADAEEARGAHRIDGAHVRAGAGRAAEEIVAAAGRARLRAEDLRQAHARHHAAGLAAARAVAVAAEAVATEAG